VSARFAASVVPSSAGLFAPQADRCLRTGRRSGLEIQCTAPFSFWVHQDLAGFIPAILFPVLLLGGLVQKAVSATDLIAASIGVAGVILIVVAVLALLNRL
jgi:hypothetical protein